MNKLLLLWRIRGSLFLLKSSTWYNIDFIYCNKDKWTKFLFQIQNTCLNDFNVSICFQCYKAYYFFCSQKSKFSTIKEFFQSQETFPQSRNFSAIRNFSTVREVFHGCGNFPQSRTFSTIKEISYEKFAWSRKFSTVKEIFYPNILVDQRDFLQTKFSTKFFSLIKEFSHKQRFLHS